MKWQSDSKILIQGVAEPAAAYYATRLYASGTQIVAGVESGQGGSQVGEIPVFDLVEQAVAAKGEIDITLIFLPPYRVLDGALEAIAAGIRQIIIISAGVPPLDMVYLLREAQTTNTFILGSGSQGLLLPGKLWLGTSEPEFYTPGSVGIVSRTEQLMGEIARELTQAGIGQSIAVSLGTDSIIGSTFEQWLQILEEDEATEAIVLLGQPNGCAEIAAAEYIAAAIEKPVVAYIAGLHAPVERRLADATTIIAAQLSHSVPAISTDKQAISAFKQAQVKVAKRPSEIPQLLKTALKMG
ncbi:MAG: CoA-binding protein [Snowella sp.]